MGAPGGTRFSEAFYGTLSGARFSGAFYLLTSKDG